MGLFREGLDRDVGVGREGCRMTIARSAVGFLIEGDDNLRKECPFWTLPDGGRLGT